MGTCGQRASSHCQEHRHSHADSREAECRRRATSIRNESFRRLLSSACYTTFVCSFAVVTYSSAAISFCIIDGMTAEIVAVIPSRDWGCSSQGYSCADRPASLRGLAAHFLLLGRFPNMFSFFWSWNTICRFRCLSSVQNPVPL